VTFTQTYDDLKLVLGEFPLENLQIIIDPDGRYISLGVTTTCINWVDLLKPVVQSKTDLDDFDLEIAQMPNIIGLFRTYTPIEAESTTDVTKFHIMANSMSDYPEEDEVIIIEQCFIELEQIIQAVVKVLKRSQIARNIMHTLSTT